MPSKSKKQRRMFYARFGAKWTKAHHFDKLKRGRKKKS